ncbi:hypothetical protein D3C84_1097180 [compost metagenome]
MVDDEARSILRAHRQMTEARTQSQQGLPDPRGALQPFDDFDDFHQRHRVEKVKAADPRWQPALRGNRRDR